MKSFQCQVCGQIIFFENTRCLQCQSALGYLEDHHVVSAFEPEGEARWRALHPDAEGALYRRCRNGIDWQACNWMIPLTAESDFCLSCQLNQMIPDLSDPDNMNYWRKLEQGKRRLVYSLMRLGLPVVSKTRDARNGLAFEFLKEADRRILDEDDVRVITGHRNGLITVNVNEADDLERERTRLNLNEVYRSVLGHFRHESGHYYWQLLIRSAPWLDEFRHLFGDERTNYQMSLNAYYRQGPLRDWPDSYISAYATAHPWEDWAECWAHYITIVDALETANNFGVVVSHSGMGQLFPPIDSYNAERFSEMLEQWLPLTYAVNSINRSAGQRDLYPFVLSGPVVQKLEFVHRVIRGARSLAD